MSKIRTGQNVTAFDNKGGLATGGNPKEADALEGLPIVRIGAAFAATNSGGALTLAQKLLPEVRHQI